MSEQETDTQRATRSALGGFERDAKTFQGHLDKVLVSAEAFVRRCEKFSKQEPGHQRLAETEFLLAEAKRILGQPQVSVAEMNAPIHEENARVLGLANGDAAERLAGLETAVTALARIALNTRHRDMVADGQADTEDALSYLRNWLGHLAPLPKREPEVPRVVLETGDVVTGQHFGGQAHAAGIIAPGVDPAAGLVQREQERVQAVLDAAASKALANPLAAALAPPAVPVNPFAGWPAPSA